MDVHKDSTSDTAFLKRQTVGFGHAGGYVISNQNDKKAVRATKDRKGIVVSPVTGPAVST